MVRARVSSERTTTMSLIKGQDSNSSLFSTEYDRRYVLRSDVAAWAASRGYLHQDGSHVGQYTLNTAVQMAVSGELYTLDASHFPMPPSDQSAFTTTTLMSAANRVFVVDEIVEVIVSFCADLIADMLDPHSLHGLPPLRWANRMSRLARVNSTCFEAASAWLWSYIPKFSCLSAVITDVRVRKWRNTPCVAQWK